VSRSTKTPAASVTTWRRLRATLHAFQGMVRLTTHTKTPAENLRRAATKATTWKEFGKALQAFRGMVQPKGLSVRDLAPHVLLSRSALSARENGQQKFEEKELRAYLMTCNADEELVTACLGHYRRIAESLPRHAARRARRHQIARIIAVFMVPLVVVIFVVGIANGSLARLFFTPAPLPAKTGWPTWTTIVGNVSKTGSCLTVDQTSPVDRAPAFMQKCSSNAVDWLITPAGHTDGGIYSRMYNLINVNSGKCLDVTKTGSVIQQTCNNSSTQIWQISHPNRRDQYQDGWSVGWLLASFYNLYFAVDYRLACLTIPGSKDNTGTQLTAAACTNTDNQMYWITDPDTSR
jgi:Ricin-type beta-trefoil lectin domain